MIDRTYIYVILKHLYHNVLYDNYVIKSCSKALMRSKSVLSPILYIVNTFEQYFIVKLVICIERHLNNIQTLIIFQDNSTLLIYCVTL